MVKTISNENYVKGSQQLNGILYNELLQVNFLPLDNVAVCYVVLGEVVNILDPDTGDQIPVNQPLVNRAITYTQDELKTLIEATGRNFNADGTNLLLDEINNYADDIILNDITNKPEMYYGLDVSKWQKV